MLYCSMFVPAFLFANNEYEEHAEWFSPGSLDLTFAEEKFYGFVTSEVGFC